MAAGLVGRLTRCHTRALRFASYFLWSTPCSMGETGDSYSSDSHKNGMGLDGWCHASLQALTKYTSTKYYIYSLPFLSPSLFYGFKLNPTPHPHLIPGIIRHGRVRTCDCITAVCLRSSERLFRIQ